MKVYSRELRPCCIPVLLTPRFRSFGEMRRYFKDYDAYMHPRDDLPLEPIQVVPPPEPTPAKPTTDPASDDLVVAEEDPLD